MVEREERCPKKKAYLRMSTTLGDLNLELHADMVPLTPFPPVHSLCACVRVRVDVCPRATTHIFEHASGCFGLWIKARASSCASLFILTDHMTQ